MTIYVSAETAWVRITMKMAEERALREQAATDNISDDRHLGRIEGMMEARAILWQLPTIATSDGDSPDCITVDEVGKCNTS